MLPSYWMHLRHTPQCDQSFPTYRLGPWVVRGFIRFLILFCFIVAIGCYGLDKSSTETLDQHFSLGRLAKSITALPSRDGRRLPCPMAASTQVLPSQDCQNDPPSPSESSPGHRALPYCRQEASFEEPGVPEDLILVLSYIIQTLRRSGGWQSCEWGARRARGSIPAPKSWQQSQMLMCTLPWCQELALRDYVNFLQDFTEEEYQSTEQVRNMPWQGAET